MYTQIDTDQGPIDEKNQTMFMHLAIASTFWGFFDDLFIRMNTNLG